MSEKICTYLGVVQNCTILRILSFKHWNEKKWKFQKSEKTFF